MGFEIKPTSDFTFTKALDIGLMKIVDYCVEVGERASKVNFWILFNFKKVNIKVLIENLLIF